MSTDIDYDHNVYVKFILFVILIEEFYLELHYGSVSRMANFGSFIFIIFSHLCIEF